MRIERLTGFAYGKRDAEEVRPGGEPRQAPRPRDLDGLRRHLPRLPQDVHDEVAREADGDEVHHDRVDDLVGPEPRLEVARKERPERPAGRGDDDEDGDQEDRRKPREDDAGPRAEERADVQLALAADVEEPRAEREGDGEPREDERARVEQDEPQPVRAPERAAKEDAVHGSGFSPMAATTSAPTRNEAATATSGERRPASLSHRLTAHPPSWRRPAPPPWPRPRRTTRRWRRGT